MRGVIIKILHANQRLREHGIEEEDVLVSSQNVLILMRETEDCCIVIAPL